jgi:cytochrome c
MPSKIALIILSILLFIAGCGESKTEKKPQIQYDAKALLESKCASCHDLNMPPHTSEDEKAPPMYTITIHLKDWIKSDTDTEKREKYIAFLQTYVLHPSKEISYCDEKSLAQYGLMPSQAKNVNKEEVAAIAAYIYQRYDQKKMLEIVQERNRIARLPAYQQVLEGYDCKYCHLHGNGKLAPTFAQIGQKYGKAGIDQIKESIQHGSKGKWEHFYTPMKPYPALTPKQLEGIAKWISEQRS